uniref:NADH-ubiquinone oxidoreductase chain 3 n=1 Tax=Bactrothrips quadrituberculatus TaxID=1246465 RepID=A0A8E5JZK4_9NEOP|nr:NADH dehydrogenase subunit 3 [Bactrothrips quadrituberculatus]QVD42824.1 NADH dehydrogenase subunit 3 [Bactrothrips quadrituberculatus]
MFLLNLIYLILFICIFLYLVSFLISKKKTNDYEKSSPFECGFNLFNSPRNPFSLRFFLISIIFLIFDIEVVLLMPFMLNMYMNNSIVWLFMFIFFLLILIWGLIHEWFLGSLDWI